MGQKKKHEKLTLRIASVTFFSFNKARIPRVSYTNSNSVTQRTQFTHKNDGNIPLRWHFAAVSLIF